jgi:membrane protease YdiL (CAAX protease family)
MNPAFPAPREPHWGWEDVALLIGSVLPVLFIASLIVRGVRLLASSESIQTLAFNGLIDALLFGVLYALVAARYGRPFWRSLHFVRGWRLAWFLLPAGAALALGASMAGVALRAPIVANPVEKMVAGPGSLAMVGVFAVIVAPVFEEITFRGFLFPLLARSVGGEAAIVLSAIPFALLHGQQNQWSWQHIVVIGIAGLAFGYVRYRTDSTAASTLVHSGYNLLFYIGFVAQRWIANR